MRKVNKISEKWSKVAMSWLGNKNGMHCHWCKHKQSFDGEVRCDNKKSKFCDGSRIRSWDGLACAEECGFFELEKWYTDDKNFDKYFKKGDKEL